MSTIGLYPLEKAVARKIREDYEYGDTVSNADLNRMLEIKKPGGKFSYDEYQEMQFARLARINGLRKILLEDYNIWFRNVRFEGYCLIQPKEQTSKAMEDFEKTTDKILQHTSSRLTNLAYELLGEQEIQANVIACGTVAAIKNMVDRQLSLPAPEVKKLKADG